MEAVGKIKTAPTVIRNTQIGGFNWPAMASVIDRPTIGGIINRYFKGKSDIE